MAKNILPKVRTLLPSSFVVRALVSEGPRFHCGNCGDVMFVRGASGLCPLCFNDRKPWSASLDQREVPSGMVLAGILDDPSIEDLECLGAMLPGEGSSRSVAGLSLRD
jgi:hypothetical protein